MRTIKVLSHAMFISLSLCVGASAKPAAAEMELSLAAPIGVRIETVYLDGLGSQTGRYGPRPGTEIYADENGRTLYASARDGNGRSACYGNCVQTWQAFSAPADGHPVGAWSIIVRDDGQRQWALAGKPLYTHAKDKVPGEFAGEGVDGVWKVALKLSQAPSAMPAGFDAIETESRDGESLVLSNGKAVYYFEEDGAKVSKCYGACASKWPPLQAPRVALPLGDFSVIGRADGIKQWAYKGKPLYASADYDRAGMAQGYDGGGPWHQMMLSRYFFPPKVKLVQHPKHGIMMTTATGMTLYARESHYYGPGLHTDRSRLRGDPEIGLRLGVSSCIDRCLQGFSVLEAPKDARPWGRWTVVTRPNGVHQWAYRNYPLYTYSGDNVPGDTLAHDIYELTDGTNALFWRVALP